MKLRTKSIQHDRLFDITALCEYLQLGKATATKFAKLSGAELHIGRRCLYDRAKIDAALDNLLEG